MIIIEVLGRPIPLNRPRACKRGEFIRMYDSQVQEKKQVQWQVRSQYQEDPLKTPLLVDLDFIVPIPSHTSKVRTRLMLQNDLPPMVKPDLDNLIKFILDCLNGILFDDDSQIVEISARKKYGSIPRTVVRAISMNEIEEKMKDSNKGPFHEDNN